MTDTSGQSNALTILFPCVGRRIELMQAFRAAAQRLSIALRVVALDQTRTAPGLYCADVAETVPPVSDAGYIPALLDAVRRHDARALIPTIDTDLRCISEHAADFEAADCTPLIAPPATIDICRDKIKTYEFLTRSRIDTPRTYTPDEIRALASPKFPLFLKPRFGSASRWVHKIENGQDLEFFLRQVHDPIVQEFVNGVEHTLDVYVGLTGEVRCVVPRVRWQVRSGEVAKGVVVKDPAIMEAGKRVVEAFETRFRGMVTLQCIVTADKHIRFIEINPRFGGGAPLGIAAGADYPGWLLQELTGRQPAIAFDGFRHGTCMLRYDWSVFVSLEDDLKPRIKPPSRDWPSFE